MSTKRRCKARWWLVTGYSGKLDGFAYVVPGRDREEALAAVVEALSGRSTDELMRARGVTDDESGAITTLVGLSANMDEYEDEYRSNGEVRWCWSVAVAEIADDGSANGAVQW